MAVRHLMWIQLIGGTHLNVKSIDLRPHETDIAACVWIYPSGYALVVCI